jgi:hypothetical protein
MNHTSYRFILPLILIFILIFPGCEKDPSDPAGESGYRIKQMKIFRNESLIYSEDYSYEDSRISRIDFFTTNQSWFDSTIYLLQYPEIDKIVIINYAVSNGDWIELLKDSLIFHNSLLIQRTNYLRNYEGWKPQFRFEYSYTNGLLSKAIKFTPDSYDWNEAYRFVYEYDGKKLISATNYQDENLSFIFYQDIADYEGDKLKSVTYWKYFSGHLIEFSKYDFQYQNDLVSSIDFFVKQETWKNNGVILYSYNEMNNLETIVDDRPSLWPLTEKLFLYEKGAGNYSRILPPEGDIMDKWLNPHPINAGPLLLD